MAKVAELVRPGGEVVIAVPNSASLERWWYGAAWDAWDVPRHVHHFSPASLRYLLKDVGLIFERLDFECYTIAHRSKANRRLSSVPYAERCDHLRAPRFEKSLGRLLAMLRTSSAVQLIGRRP
jgi:hypothetical protein